MSTDTPRTEAQTRELPVGAVLASALMAANYPGDSGEDVDRLIDELAKRGYRIERAAWQEAADQGPQQAGDSSEVREAERAALVLQPLPGQDTATFEATRRRVMACYDALSKEPAPERPLDVELLADAITNVRKRYATAPGYDEMYDSALAAVGELVTGPYRDAIAAEYVRLASEPQP